MKKLILNGKLTNTTAETIEMLLNELKVPRQGIAIAVNDEIIPRTKHGEYTLNEGDSVEIIRPIGGG